MILAQAIQSVMGVSLQEMRSPARQGHICLARAVYIDLRRRWGGSPMAIARDLCKSKRLIYHYLRLTRQQLDFNLEFTRQYRAVEAIVCPQLLASPPMVLPRGLRPRGGRPSMSQPQLWDDLPPAEGQPIAQAIATTSPGIPI